MSEPMTGQPAQPEPTCDDNGQCRFFMLCEKSVLADVRCKLVPAVYYGSPAQPSETAAPLSAEQLDALKRPVNYASLTDNDRQFIATIDHKEAEITRLREALEPFIGSPTWLSIGAEKNVAEVRVWRHQYERAATALGAGVPEGSKPCQSN